jgi:predicted CoA-binding protein
MMQAAMMRQALTRSLRNTTEMTTAKRIAVSRSAATVATGAFVDEILALPALPKVIWGQLSVRDDAAAAKAEAAGIKVVMDRCPAIEYPRLVG